MCRMLGMVSAGINNRQTEVIGSGAAENVAPLPSWQHLVGTKNALRIQAETGNIPPKAKRGHEDSWGVAWFDDAGQPAVIRQTGSAAHSAYYVFASEAATRRAAGIGPARVLLAHLRKASCGGVTSENAHPIQVEYRSGTGETRETLLVAHNGTVHTPLLQTLRDDLHTASRQEANADSDTVVLAGWLANEIAGSTSTIFDALTDALQKLFERAADVSPGGSDLTKAYSGMNLLIGHRNGLFALRQFSQWPAYYTLFARPLTAPDDGEAGGWIIASEPTDESTEWEPLPPHVLTFFPAGTGNVQTAVVAAPFTLAAVMV